MENEKRVKLIGEKLKDLRDYAVDQKIDSFLFICTGFSFFYALAYKVAPSYEEVEATVAHIRSEIKESLRSTEKKD